MIRQSIMAEAHDAAKLLTSWWPEGRQIDRKEPGQHVPFKDSHSLTCFLQSDPPPNSPFSMININGLTYGHPDPTASQESHQLRIKPLLREPMGRVGGGELGIQTTTAPFINFKI
jgi:hypothetical protein